MGNRGNRHDVPALARAAADDDPMVRESAEWALARLATYGER
jgi:epoxyqueuosine reductase QueG